MQSTKRNLIQHQSGEQEVSLWLLASSPLKVNFNTVVAKGRFWETEQVKVFAEEPTLKEARGRMEMEGRVQEKCQIS